MITVFLIADHPSTRTMLRLRLELEPDIRVIGAGGHDEETAAEVAALEPNVVILDAMVPISDRASAARLLAGVPRGSAVVVLGLYDDPATRTFALAAGASALISKHGPDDLLLAAVRAAAIRSPRA